MRRALENDAYDEYVLVHQNVYQYYFTVPFFCDLFCVLHTGEPGGNLNATGLCSGH